MDKISTKELGYLAENIAARYMESQGFTVIGRNYRKPWGEIDVIVEKDGIFVFVEVKANRQEFTAADFSPEARANPVKLAKVIRTAALYMEYEAKQPEAEWQVDVISVTFNAQNQNAKLKHFKNVAADYQ